ncbi:MAG: DUF4382 domain-containing protein [Haloarculaceae archaeon]
MEHTREQLDRRSYLKTTGLATAGMVGLAGCAGDSGDGSSGGDTDDSDGGNTYGTLSTAVTDQPSAIGDFESLTVTIDGIWIKPSGGSDDEEEDDSDEEMNETEMNETETNETATNETDTEDDEMDDEEMDGDDSEGDGSGRRYIEFEEPQDADLVQLQGSSTKLIDETEVETGDYEFLQINVASTEGIFTGGDEAEVTTPGNAPLKFNTSFEVRPEEMTRFIADFAPNKRGNNGYIIRPVATSTTVLYGDEEYDGGDDGTTDDSDEERNGNETTDGGNETTDGGSGGNETNTTNTTDN